MNFELHTLGWEAFQNLCGHIAREVLGQTVTVFSSTNDAGRDGGFQGVWKKNGKETFSGTFVLQCKFTARRDEHLHLSQLEEELSKAKRLASLGISNTYLLITNAKVTGKSDLRIRQEFKKIQGLNFFAILGEEWINQSILTSTKLRAFVPRIYGLGDLSQILDERAYRQAEEILQTWRDNLAKFVPTAAHERSVRALMDKGFVLLLGDAMAGKSTIAAALALAASDRWSCLPVFVKHPNDLAQWNPDEPHQFLWVDDAFGQIQMDSSLTAAWNRVMPHLTAALRRGARILFTSRTYIYRAALKEIKESAFPLLRDSRVVINVEDLTLTEKERILYNHLRLGTQPSEFRSRIKPFLSSIAASQKFFPEVAKRLGDPFFTRNLAVNGPSLQRFVDEPKEFLYDVILELDRAHFACLSLLFMRGGQIHIPPKFEKDEMEALTLLGASLSQVLESLSALEGSLVARSVESGVFAWKFRHPSVRDAMALHVAGRPELLDIYLGGASATEIISEVVCGGEHVAGAKVFVPESRFSTVSTKIAVHDLSDWSNRYRMLGFLSTRCSDAFLALWVKQSRSGLLSMYEHFSSNNHQFCTILARLKRLGRLPEKLRQRYVRDVKAKAVSSLETTFLSEDVRDILTNEEFTEIMNIVKDDVSCYALAHIQQAEDRYDEEYDPSDHFDDLRTSFQVLQEYFYEDDDIYFTLEEGIDSIRSTITRLEEQNERKQREKAESEAKEQKERELQEEMEEEMANTARADRKRETQGRVETAQTSLPSPSRSIFDDVDV